MTEVVVHFGPSRSPRFPQAKRLAERDARAVRSWPTGEVIAAFTIDLEHAHAGGDLARLIGFVEGWKSSYVTVDGEHEAPYLVSQMALCARDFARRFGRCTWHDSPGNWILPKCRICPLRPPDAIEMPERIVRYHEEVISADGKLAILFDEERPPKEPEIPRRPKLPPGVA